MKRAVVVVGLLAVGALLAVVLWPRPPAAPEARPDTAAEPEPLDAWLGPSPEPTPSPERAPAESKVPDEMRVKRGAPGPFPGRRFTGRGGGDAGAGRGSRRRDWRRRLTRRVEVVPLGPSEPALSPEEALSALRAARRDVRRCARESGIDRDQWRQARSTARTLQFDVGPDGHVTAGSVSIEPPLPEGMQRCIEQSLEKASTEVSPGPDGARVAFEMPARGPRRRFAGGDAGTRPRSRGGR